MDHSDIRLILGGRVLVYGDIHAGERIEYGGLARFLQSNKSYLHGRPQFRRQCIASRMRNSNSHILLSKNLKRSKNLIR
jgi:hypothetical protein